MSTFKALVAAFHNEAEELDEVKRALRVLEKLLLPFSISGFLQRYPLRKGDVKAILTELLYSLYYSEIDLSLPLEWEYLLIQIAAVKASRSTLGKIIKMLDLKQQLRLLAFAFRHYREGSYPILLELKKTSLEPLVTGLMRNYYDRELFYQGQDEAKLQEHAQRQCKAVFSLLHQLIPAIFVPLLTLYQEANMASEPYQRLYNTFVANRYTVEEFDNFFRLFGLRGYPPIMMEDPHETDSLVKKLEALLKLGSLTTLTPLALHHILSFLSALLWHLDSYLRRPSLYEEGRKALSFSIATCGKELDKEPALQSLLEASRNIPIAVFDQSEEPLFSKNRRFIKNFPSVRQVSKEEALQTGLKDLLATTRGGDFGFGGARNCQYLLTSCFLHSAGSLCLVDDDIQVPETLVYSAALFAKLFQDEYVGTAGFQLGRVTKSMLRYWDLEDILNAPETTTMFPKWHDEPSSTGISECVCKPKICLNTPHGCEERHFPIRQINHFILQPAYHLCGTRFPEGEIPTHFFIGLDKYLEKLLPHIFLIGMTSNLIDPTNESGRCALPWNEQLYSNLSQGLEAIGASQEEMTKRFLKNVQEFFSLRQSKNSTFMHACQRLIHLDVAATINAFQKSQKLKQREAASLTRLGRLYKRLQEDAGQFWELGLQLAESGPKILDALDETKFLNCPITYGFYLLACSVGRGDFCRIALKAAPQIQSLLKS